MRRQPRVYRCPAHHDQQQLCAVRQAAVQQQGAVQAEPGHVRTVAQPQVRQHAQRGGEQLPAACKGLAHPALGCQPSRHSHTRARSLPVVPSPPPTRAPVRSVQARAAQDEGRVRDRRQEHEEPGTRQAGPAAQRDGAACGCKPRRHLQPNQAELAGRGGLGDVQTEGRLSGRAPEHQVLLQGVRLCCGGRYGLAALRGALAAAASRHSRHGRGGEGAAAAAVLHAAPAAPAVGAAVQVAAAAKEVAKAAAAAAAGAVAGVRQG